jgi:hypothetical protein
MDDRYVTFFTIGFLVATLSLIYFIKELIKEKPDEGEDISSATTNVGVVGSATIVLVILYLFIEKLFA